MKKLLAMSLMSLAFALTSVPVCAAEYTSDGTASCLVTAEIGSTYSVSVPATLTLSENEDTGKFEGTYRVGAKGNIAGNKVVSITPSTNTMNMTGRTTGVTATANVLQNITQFVLKSPQDGQALIRLDDYAYVDGFVDVNITDSDLYEGTIVFNFAMSDK